MRRLIMLILMLLVLSPCSAEAFQLLWNAVTTNSDGTIITDLAAYVTYYRPSSTAPWELLGEVGPTATSVVVEPFRVGQFSVRAKNALGIESLDSNIAVTKRPNKVTITGVIR